MKSVLRTAGILIPFLAAHPPAQGNGAARDRLAFNVGIINILDGEDLREGELGVEWQSGTRWSALQPIVGILGSTDGSVYAYGGLRVELSLGERWTMAPSFAAGLYQGDHGRDLGGLVEFRSQLELCYSPNGRSRFGVAYYHLSNAHLYDVNPGTEAFVVTYSVPIGE